MVKRKLQLTFVVLVIALAILACGVNATTAKITNVIMASDPDGANPTETFTPEQPFYALVEVENAPDDTTFRAVWTAVEAEGVEANFVIDEAELTAGSGTHQFSLTNDSLWPAGTYQVEIYMNGELAETVEFQVR